MKKIGAYDKQADQYNQSLNAGGKDTQLIADQKGNVFAVGPDGTSRLYQPAGALNLNEFIREPVPGQEGYTLLRMPGSVNRPTAPGPFNRSMAAPSMAQIRREGQSNIAPMAQGLIQQAISARAVRT
jgi:hypothetical protein